MEWKGETSVAGHYRLALNCFKKLAYSGRLATNPAYEGYHFLTALHGQGYSKLDNHEKQAEIYNLYQLVSQTAQKGISSSGITAGSGTLKPEGVVVPCIDAFCWFCGRLSTSSFLESSICIWLAMISVV